MFFFFYFRSRPKFYQFLLVLHERNQTLEVSKCWFCCVSKEIPLTPSSIFLAGGGQSLFKIFWGGNIHFWGGSGGSIPQYYFWGGGWRKHRFFKIMWGENYFWGGLTELWSLGQHKEPCTYYTNALRRVRLGNIPAQDARAIWGALENVRSF